MPRKSSGSFSPPPPNAPRETTTPGSERPTAEQIRAARANARDLPPFNPGGGKRLTLAEQAAVLGKTIDEVRALRRASGVPEDDGQATPQGATRPPAQPVPAPPAPVPPQTLVDPQGKPITSSVRLVDQPLPQKFGLRRVGGPAPAVPVADPPAPDPPTADPPPPVPDPPPLDAALPPPPVQDAPYHPARSDTDSPARGVPAPIADPGKKITGGFGDAGDAQYFPLDGRELRELIYALMDQLHARLQDDLRFTIAATYPRCAARVVVEVDAYGVDGTLQIEKILVPPHTRTPLEIARQRADHVCFCVIEARQEMTEAGESVAPPNQTRLELGLTVPRKQVVETPGGRMIVDVRSDAGA